MEPGNEARWNLGTRLDGTWEQDQLLLFSYSEENSLEVLRRPPPQQAMDREREGEATAEVIEAYKEQHVTRWREVRSRWAVQRGKAIAVKFFITTTSIHQCFPQVKKGGGEHTTFP